MNEILNSHDKLKLHKIRDAITVISHPNKRRVLQFIMENPGVIATDIEVALRDFSQPEISQMTGSLESVNFIIKVKKGKEVYHYFNAKVHTFIRDLNRSINILELNYL